MTASDWTTYLADFHAARPGITETVLGGARDAAGRDPYAWAADAVPDGARVLDLACGSAPLAALLPGRTYLGLDASAEELAGASARGPAVVRAGAHALPVRSGSVDTVVVSLALMLLPLPAALAEVSRVLRPGGLLVATVPHPRPLPARDWWRYARLCLALRHAGLRYPNDLALRAPAGLLGAAGLTLESDDASAFACQIRSPAVADDLLASLYLPQVGPHRMKAGRRVVRTWTGTSITVPVRRLVARRTA